MEKEDENEYIDGPDPINYDENDISVAKLNEVYALKELIILILDYYSFKNNISDTENESGDEWKKGTKYDRKAVVPSNIDILIEKSFESQINKFI